MLDVTTSQKTWQRAKETIQATVGHDVYDSFLARLELEQVREGKVSLSVPTNFLRTWIESHYADTILAAWKKEDPYITRLEITLRTCATHILKPDTTPAPVQPARAIWRPTAAPATKSTTLENAPLQPRYVFETFVVHRSNVLAHTVARQIATSRRGDPAVLHNPLYVHATSGLGKSHLLQAIASACGNDRNALYLTAERFVFLSPAHHTALKTVDVFIIDDLQLLRAKMAQQEFGRVVDALVSSERQLVVASDRPPRELEGFDDRVLARLGSGLVVEIGPLDQEVRLEILKRRLAVMRQEQLLGSDVSDPVVAYLAQAFVKSGWDIEGALNRILAKAKMGELLTMDTVEQEMRDLVRPTEPKHVRVEEIQRVVASFYSVSRSDIISARRTMRVVLPRQVAMYLCRELTMRSMPEIGRRFGGRDHTTVLHAYTKISWLIGERDNIKPLTAKNNFPVDPLSIAVDQKLKQEVEHLKAKLTQ